MLNVTGQQIDLSYDILKIYTGRQGGAVLIRTGRLHRLLVRTAEDTLLSTQISCCVELIAVNMTKSSTS